MRILLVSATAHPITSASGDGPWSQSVHLAGLAKALTDLGHHVTIAGRKDAPDLPREAWLAEGTHVVTFPAGPAEPLAEKAVAASFPAVRDGLAAAIDELQPDVVHAHRWVAGRAALAVTWPRGIPLVQTFHGVDPDDGWGHERASVERTLVHRASHVIAASSTELFDLVRLGASMGDVTVAGPGYDPALFRPDGPTERASRPRIVALGRMTDDRGFDTAVTALASIPGAELVVIGGPKAEEVDQHPVTRRLRDLAVQSGVGDRLILRGRVRRPELAGLLRSASVAVCLPTAEPSGTPVVEAAACGVPVVATAIGAHTDLVASGITGLLVPPGRPDAVAEGVRSLLDDEQLRNRLGEAARNRAERRYRWQTVAEATLHAYRAALAATGKGSLSTPAG